MTNAGERLEGKKTADAREEVVAWLREQDLLEKEEEVPQNIGTAERTGAIVEPLPKLQWWVDVEKPFAMQGSGIPGISKGDMVSLKEVMRKAVESKAVSITPDRFEHTYFQWINNLRPWCISRQIWFGHRVPVWYKGDEIVVGTAPDEEGWEQDPDTLDTWFSSGLWTFSTLGWPEKTKELETFHPTNLLETGYDILFFWVARMVLMSGFLLGEVPFKQVYLHGLVRDGQGRKMSKSLGNIIDPLDMIDKYSADAVRLSLIMGAAPGNDLKLSEDRIRGYKNFGNKVWNIARFVLESVEATKPQNPTLEVEDMALVEETRKITREVAAHIENFRLDLAADAAYQYVWHRFADEIIEESKAVLKGEDVAKAQSRAEALQQSLVLILTILHPFMPFVTEEIWEALPNTQNLLIVEKWPN